MTRRLRRGGLCLATALAAACSNAPGEAANMSMDTEARTLVAHRGASGYAPEHTRQAYELALEHGADFIEPDLQITRDGVLIALHDLTLERTTDVSQVFPERFVEETFRGQTVQRWYANEFSLEEIRQLDAGSWFDASFAGARIPTFAEVIEIARGNAGIFPETKAPEVYGDRGFDMERLVVEELRKHGLDAPGADPSTPVIIQSFSPESLRILRHEMALDLPSTFLIGGGEGAAEWLTPEGLDRVADFATGIGPSKSLLVGRPDIVEMAHAADLSVIPYTFRARDPGTFATVGDEMAHFLYDLGVDGLFTDNPDLFPRTRHGPGS